MRRDELTTTHEEQRSLWIFIFTVLALAGLGIFVFCFACWEAAFGKARVLAFEPVGNRTSVRTSPEQNALIPVQLLRQVRIQTFDPARARLSEERKPCI